MTELVNVKYFIEKTGLHPKWCKVLLNKRLEVIETISNTHYYNKKEVDKLVKIYLLSQQPKKENEWDIQDIMKHFGLSRSYVQTLALDKNFPNHFRKIAINEGRHTRVWSKDQIESLDLHKLEGGDRKKRVFSKKKAATQSRLLSIEMQFLRGFRL